MKSHLMGRTLFRVVLALSAVLQFATPVRAQDYTVQTITTNSSGGGCTAVPLSCASFTLGSVISVNLAVTGTFTGTLTFEGSADNTTWFTISGTNLADGSSATTTTATGQFSFSNAGLVGIRARATAAMTGTATVTAVRGYASARALTPFFLRASLGPGTTCSTPSLNYHADTDTGIGYLGANNAALCAGGATIADWNASRVLFAQPIYAPDGAVGAVAIARSADPTTGWWFAANTISGSVGGTERFRQSTSATDLGLALRLSSNLQFNSSFAGSGDLILARLAAGQLLIENDGTHGIALDVATDGTAKLLSRAGADTAAFQTNALTVTGSATMGAGGQTAINLSGGIGATYGFGPSVRSTPTSNGSGPTGFGYAVNNASPFWLFGFPTSSTTYTIGTNATSHNTSPTSTFFTITSAGAVGANVSFTTPILAGSGTGTSVANVGANSCGTTAATIAGNQVSGVITVGATSGTQCRVTFTTAAPVARDCTVTDSTTTVATRATVVDTSNTDFLGAFVAGDKVTYQCTVR